MTVIRLPTRRPQAARLGTGVAGFTMVELITVLLVMGILGAIGVERFFDSKQSDASAYAAQVKTIVRYAQKVAVAQHRAVYVSVGSNSVGLCYQSACGSANFVPAPSGSNSGSATTKAACVLGGAYAAQWMCEAAPTSVTLTPSATLPAVFFFDAIGRPYVNGDVVPTSTFYQSTAPTLTVSSGTTSFAVSVEPETGYVH